MRHHPWKRATELALTTFAACVAVVSCGVSSNAPTELSGITISNLTITTLGLRDEVCGGVFDYQVIDELKFDFHVTGGDISGATVNNRTSDPGNTSGIAVGVLEVCASDQNPCEGRQRVCVISGSTGSQGAIRAYPRSEWKPQTTWRISVHSPIGVSNELITAVERPQLLPSGDRAGIARLSIQRCGTPGSTCTSSTETYSVTMVVFNPRIEQRTIFTKLQVFGGSGTLLRTSEHSFDEGVTRSAAVGSGIILSPAPGWLPGPPYRVVGFIRETANGSVIVEESKEISYP